MVHDGAALRGAWGNAGEIGHMPVVPRWRALPLRQSRLPRALPVARGLGAAREGDRRAAVDRARWRRCSARPLVTIENLFDPETIVVGGLAPKRLLAAAGRRRRTPAQFDRGAARPPRAAGDALRRRAGRRAARRGRARRLGRAVAALRHDVRRRAAARAARPADRSDRSPRRMNDPEPLLVLDDITKNFGAIEALRGISFSDRPRRGGGAPRRQRRRQVDAGQDHRRRARADLRAARLRGPRPRLSRRRPRPRPPASRPSTRTSRSAPMSTSSPISSWAAS